MTLKLEAGKSYMPADGRCSGPIYRDGNLFCAPNIKMSDGHDQFYQLDGSAWVLYPGEKNDRLIAEWSEPALPPMFKDLPREEQIAVMDAMLRGELERYWKDGNETGWDRVWEICPSHQYRIATRLPSVNWDHVHPSINVITRDDERDYGHCWNKMPICLGGYWGNGDLIGDTTALASFDPGTCPAEQAIIIRPGYVEDSNDPS